MRHKPDDAEDRSQINEKLIRKMSPQRDEDSPEVAGRRDASEVVERFRKDLAEALSKLTVSARRLPSMSTCRRPIPMPLSRRQRS